MQLPIQKLRSSIGGPSHTTGRDGKQTKKVDTTKCHKAKEMCLDLAYGLKTEPAFCMFLSWGQRGGVGWGWVITFICTSSHIWCYVIVPHIYDATLLCGVGWGGVITFICTSSHKWCHVIVLHIHIYDATLLCLTHMMLRCCNIVLDCLSSHIWCYAAVISSWTAFPHTYDATLL